MDFFDNLCFGKNPKLKAESEVSFGKLIDADFEY